MAKTEFATKKAVSGVAPTWLTLLFRTVFLFFLFFQVWSASGTKLIRPEVADEITLVMGPLCGFLWTAARLTGIVPADEEKPTI